MQSFYLRLFVRIISRNPEAYLFKVITLATALAATGIIALFSLNEFGYDRFHDGSENIFRVLVRHTEKDFKSNRLYNRIPPEVYDTFQKRSADSTRVSRVKLMDGVSLRVGDKSFHDQKIYAADAALTDIFSFQWVAGSQDAFEKEVNPVLLSSAAARLFFGSSEIEGRKLGFFTMGDTLVYTVAGVFKSFPDNAHERFDVIIRYDASNITAMMFDASDAGLYGKIITGDIYSASSWINKKIRREGQSFSFQSLSQIYFGPKVIGEDSRHGDRYSVIILISIVALIFILSLSGYINLTTLTLPYRAKELAIRKLAGTNNLSLIFAFLKESFFIVGISLLLGLLMVGLISKWLGSLLSVPVSSLIQNGIVDLSIVLMTLVFLLVVSPVFMAFKFTRASPTRLLSTETISFPRFKRIITFVQLGIGLFLIVASLVIKRQINYSLVKEPGQNNDQVVYMSYPKALTYEGFKDLRFSLQQDNPHVLDVVATSQLPNQMHSKEVGTDFFVFGVEPTFLGFFGFEMIRGNWFKANDGDSIMVLNERAASLIGNDTAHVIGVIRDLSAAFNLPEPPVKIKLSQYTEYRYLCIRVLEVDVQKTIAYLAAYFDRAPSQVTFLNKRFAAWVNYQEKLNTLSDVLTLVSAILCCCSIYGLSISLVRDKIKKIAIHKMFGATTWNIAILLAQEFVSPIVISILFFTPVTYFCVNEILRTFVYHTHFTWFDPLIPLGYLSLVIFLLCGFHARNLNQTNLTGSLKG